MTAVGDYFILKIAKIFASELFEAQRWLIQNINMK